MSETLNQILRISTDYDFAVLPVHSLTAEGTCTCSSGSRCTSTAKHPLISEWQHRATTDPETITNWWREWPWANVGVATGSKSKVFVLDVDPRSGGIESLERLQEQIGPLPETLFVRTGSGGFHFYFRWLHGDSYRNSNSKLGPGLDIKGENGFVVAPPSRHHSGNYYKWMNS